MSECEQAPIEYVNYTEFNEFLFACDWNHIKISLCCINLNQHETLAQVKDRDCAAQLSANACVEQPRFHVMYNMMS